MNNAVFLLAAVGASVIGSIVLWLRQRTPRDSMSSIDDFRREMQALGHQPGEAPPERPRRRVRPEPIIPADPDPEKARRLRDARRQRLGD